MPVRGEYAGLVLEDRERNLHDDSDFYAVVWNPEKGEPFEVTYRTTRCGLEGDHLGCQVDATPEVRAAYEAWWARKREAAAAERAAEAARTPARGKRLRVVSGRKVPVGLEGECIWYGDGRNYGGGRWGWAPKRVGIRDAAGTVHWTDARNVVVLVDGEPAPGSVLPAPSAAPKAKAPPASGDELAARRRAAAAKAVATRRARLAAAAAAVSSEAA